MLPTPNGPALAAMSRVRRSPRRPLLFAGLLALFAYLIVSLVFTVWTEWLWFDEAVDHADTWMRIWSAKLSLLFGGVALSFTSVSVALLLAERVAPMDAVFQRDDPLVLLRVFSAQRQNLARSLLAGMTALTLGPVLMGKWEQFTLFRFGPADRVPGMFGRSRSFYLFRLPFLQSVAAWLFSLLLITTLLTLVALILNGAIHASDRQLRVTRPGRSLLSGLFSLLFVVGSFRYWLGRYGLALSVHERFDGVNYVDQKVRAPAHQLLMIICLILAAALLVNVVKQRWEVLLIAVGSWFVVAPIALFIVPAVFQRVAVSNEIQRESRSIQRHITATKAAFELTSVDVVDLALDDPKAPASAETAANAIEALDRTRIWDVPTLTAENAKAARNAVQVAQKGSPLYSIPDVDVIPATSGVPGAPSELIGVRELVPQRGASWVNQHLIYTHGYGAVVASTTKTASGEPVFSLRDLPVEGTPPLSQPRVYVGEQESAYVVVNTNTKALDIAGGSGPNLAPSYRGLGVPLSTTGRRLAFAWKFRDLDLALSKSVTSRSQLLERRSVTTRIKAIAPFLGLDSNPYPVVHGGRILWIVDGYVTSAYYPNSDRVSGAGIVSERSGLSQVHSYARNSIRVVVDAATGSTLLFRIDKNEPIAAAYANAYPTLFDVRSMSDRFPGIEKSLRYPSDLFNIRVSIWGRVHVGSPKTFYEESDRWSVGLSDASVRKEKTDVLPEISASNRLTPAEYVVDDPLGTGPAFHIRQSLVARGQRSEAKSEQLLRALVYTSATVTPSAPAGRLTVLKVSAALGVGSSGSVGNDFSGDPRISTRETELGRGGSEVVNGETQIIPVGRALLYVRPVYVQASDPQKQRPRLQYVSVKLGNQIGFAPTLAAALEQITGIASPGPGEGTSTNSNGNSYGNNDRNDRNDRNGSIGSIGSNGDSATVPGLLAQATRRFEEAQAALKAGDLATYQAKTNEVGKLVERASALAGAPTTTIAAPVLNSEAAGAGA